MNYKVQVLMSTYNGEKYLEEQLDSILIQKDVNVLLLIRDDGSTDSTREILKKYEKKHACINVIYGENIGYKKSFMKLIKLSNPEIEFFAFADQDDVWFEDKLVRSVKKMLERMKINRENAIVYQSIPCIVNENLKKQQIQYTHELPQSYEEALINGWVQGCTMAFNKRIRDYALNYIPGINTAHDKWIFCIGYFLGEVIYDNIPTIYYRQHSFNVTGNASKEKSVWNFNFAKNQLTKAIKGTLYCNYGREIYLGFSTKLSDDMKQKLFIWCNYRTKIICKIKLLFNPRVIRKTIGGTVALKLAILFNLY